MSDMPGPRAASLVATSLGDEHLDPAVRDLALERLEALLLEAVRTVPGAEGVTHVSLSTMDGVVTLVPNPVLDEASLASLRERIDRALLLQLAPTIGAARMAVRAGKRLRPRAGSPAEGPPSPVAEHCASSPAENISAPMAEHRAGPPPHWEDVIASLVTVVASQHRTIEALLARVGAPPPPDETSRALHRVEAMVARLRDGAR